MSKAYPRLGATSAVNSRKLCSCCDLVALKKVDIEVSYMRGDDGVLLLCEAHLILAKEGLFERLFRDRDITRAQRRGVHHQVS